MEQYSDKTKKSCYTATHKGKTMNIRFYNVNILTMQDPLKLISAELWVSDDKITYIGKAKQNTIHWDREINGNGNIIMPSFKNAHSHSAMTFLRSFADDMPLMDWLTKRVFPMEEKLTPEHVYFFSKIAILEYISSGISANFDMYYFSEEHARASTEIGFKTVFCAVNTLEEKEMFYHKYKNHPLIGYELGFHAEYTTNTQALKELANLAHKLHAPIYTHNSETKDEVAACIERHGLTPTAYMEKLGLFNYGGGGYHCVYLTDADMDIFKNHNISVVTNPAANLKLASGIAPVHALLQKGINIGIGTDGPAGNNALDMFREMFLVTALAKIRENNATVVNAYEVLKMATIGSTKAMNLKNCDILAENKQADIIMIDTQQPNMQPLNNSIKNIVYSGSKSNIKMTMINGKILYENGEFFIGENPEKIYERANSLVKNFIKN